MILKPQDVLVVLKLLAVGRQNWTYASLSVELGVSPSQLHAAVQRAVTARLAVHVGERIVPHVRNLKEFLIHGLKYVFVAEQGEITRGIPTGYAGPPLEQYFSSTEEPPPVWPHPEGSVRGVGFSPLYRAAPKAALMDRKLYEYLTLVDAIRAGRARERAIAEKELMDRLEAYEKGIKSELGYSATGS